MKCSLIICGMVLAGLSSVAQELKTENLIIVTLDGYRWQEVFQGVNKKIIKRKEYVADHDVLNVFWDNSKSKRREKLMPFFWKVIAKEGQLYGNRDYGNKINCKNPRLYSYAGYSEMLVGFVDKRVKTNARIENPNSTVLEYFSSLPEFKDKVAVFSTWKVMPYIVREATGEIPVNSGKELAQGRILSHREKVLNKLHPLLQNPHGDRYDAFTFMYAMEYLKREKPRVTFISLDETDEHSHAGRYDEYIKSANRADQMIEKLWSWIQSNDHYRDKTTLLITTDHGRGRGHKTWKDHGPLQFGSSQVWLAAIGPDTPALGEMKRRQKHYQNQVAKTAAALLGLEYSNVAAVGDVIHTVIGTKSKENEVLSVRAVPK
jgi:hypothetical protein